MNSKMGERSDMKNGHEKKSDTCGKLTLFALEQAYILGGEGEKFF